MKRVVISDESMCVEGIKAGFGMRAKLISFALIIMTALFNHVSHARATRADSACERDEAGESWLALRAEGWDRSLAGVEGFERPDAVAVCLIHRGRPHVDYARNRIFLRRVEKSEDTLSLVHEYLHLAFKHHPRARDELFIESMARTLLLDEER